MRALPFIAALAIVLFAPVAYAQLTASSFTTPVDISFSPAYPGPGQAVTVSLGGASNLSQSTIVWKAGGNVIAQGVGVTSAAVVAGALGSETTVEADVGMPDGTTQTAYATLAPTEIDLLAESDSYTPPFYLGRALPSPGTDIVLHALAHFVRADGTTIPDSSIVYTWKEDGQVLGSISGTGRSSAIIPVEHVYATGDITVDARSVDGTRAGEASISMPPVQPVLLLYEDHPTLGILFNSALGASASIRDSEATFAAVPLFAQAQTPNDPSLSYAWTVNGSAVPPSTNDPSEITVNAQNSSGQAQVALELTRADNLLLDAQGKWQIALGVAPTPTAFSIFGQ